MALSDLAVYSQTAYEAMIETIAQQIELFNAASRGCISLSSAAVQGDYSEKAFYQRISGLIRRRNPYGSGTVTAKTMQHLIDVMVKVAAGTPPVNLDPGQFKWIQQNPEIAGALMGQQLAQDMMADMLNMGIISCYSALSQVSDIIYDATGLTPDTLNPSYLNSGVAKFGDRSGAIAAWIVHSKPMHDFYGNAIANAANLFTYGTVNVIGDPFGRAFVVTDCPGLVSSASPAVYHNLGLVTDAIRIEANNDFTDNFATTNGDENIARTYQAEWSYNVGVQGFKWDKTNGGAAPTDAALATSTNWDRNTTSIKDLAGVIVQTN